MFSGYVELDDWIYNGLLKFRADGLGNFRIDFPDGTVLPEACSKCTIIIGCDKLVLEDFFQYNINDASVWMKPHYETYSRVVPEYMI